MGVVTPANLQGLVPILATPFDVAGELDEASLRRLVRFQLTCEVDAIGLFGLASESFSLTEDERTRILTAVVDEVAGAVPIVAGAGGTGTRPAIEQALRTAGAGADALMILPPHLVKPDAPRLLEFFADVALAVGTTVMVQDAPALTGVSIAPGSLAELAGLPYVDYLKVEAQPTPLRVGEAVTATPAGFGVFGGQNALFCLEELDRGACGTMPACEFADALRAVLDARASGDHDLARQRYHRLMPLLRYGLQAGIAWAVHKEVLRMGGVIEHATVRSPALPLDEASRRGLLDVVRDMDLLALRGRALR